MQTSLGVYVYGPYAYSLYHTLGHNPPPLGWRGTVVPRGGGVLVLGKRDWVMPVMRCSILLENAIQFCLLAHVFNNG